MKETLIFRVNQVSDRVVVNHYGYLKGRKSETSWAQALIKYQARLDEIFAITGLCRENKIISKEEAKEVFDMIDTLDRRISRLIEEI